MKRPMLTIAACILLTGSAMPASSQSFPPLPLRNNRQIPDGYISVQSGLSIALPLAEADSYEEQQNRAIKSFYQIAGSNCAILLQTIAEACEISSLSSNADMMNDARGQKLMVRGQITMSVKLKPATEAGK